MKENKTSKESLDDRALELTDEQLRGVAGGLIIRSIVNGSIEDYATTAATCTRYKYSGETIGTIRYAYEAYENSVTEASASAAAREDSICLAKLFTSTDEGSLTKEYGCLTCKYYGAPNCPR